MPPLLAREARQVERRTMSFKTMTVGNDAGVAVVTFNRPDKMNAMNPQFHEDMTAVLEQLRYDDAVRILVLTGAGAAFCAGMDLKEIFHDLKDQPAAYDRIIRMATEWRGRTLRYYPKPTIAMVNGYCFGGAFSIIEACDIAIAADEATFGLSEINFDGFPGGSVSKSLANALHPRDALFYAMTGRQFGGRHAAEIKLVNFSVPLVQLHAETIAVAREIAMKDPHSLRAAKDAYRFSLEMSWEASMDYTAAKEVELHAAQDVSWKEGGVADFVEGKYKPGLGGREKEKK
ncbi:p-hydroxycinnamoyl CoA hydratase/lyase [Microbacteriaceae bacterium K1510]|nr:p-hydroxycinnamoyl CoA hydratase/lyase [Microbacteriaceae bacterium K1510]